MNEQACTSILVGKKATIDGSTMIARNDDTFMPITPQRFLMQPAAQNRHEILKSTQNGFQAPLPTTGYRATMTPNVEVQEKGLYGESSINEKNVAMSCTESVYGNEKALAYDPLVSDGLAEDCMQHMVAPFINSAREGVRYLGDLIKKYGSAEGNGVLFADQDEVWYMEIVTGHHWAATRIPDDAYAIAANQVAQQQIDFNDPDNYMWSAGLQEFVIEHHLNPDREGFNFRRIFGTDNNKDRHYNTPRVWYGQRCFNPSTIQEPTSSDLPFICRAERLLAVEDLEYILGSHYNETQYDPLGQGSQEDKVRFRPISLNRTQNAHVLQIRNDVPKENAALMWICFGVPSFAPFVPFYTNAHDTDPAWSETPLKYDIKSAYWMYRTLSMLVESHHSNFIQKDLDYLKDLREKQRTMIADFDQKVQNLTPAEITDELTQANYAISAAMKDKTMQMIADLVVEGLTLSKLTFDMDKNL
ncbi:C69 family dipeptidase [Ligilactobacillus ceti]|uniref:Dipeptidase n=1 Tax=Ligilactobacillus ceti DSM 22408 TaxID=1122146 RepID=A0A0R2KHY4_9LACO|nr:C69 family dipeptidase [Ligilactobacillus ceti]KRN88875.1 dipeptidase A [Ligilactobacillus ceti DSM 22408]